MTMVFTVGHSTRSAAALRELLIENGVELLVDVRRFAGSRRWPQFNGETMRGWLADAKIDYRHDASLGGRRKSDPNSPNGYWQHKSFRAYADYLSTPEFRHALERLIGMACERPTAIMCAEAVPWRCHRRLIADALVARGIEVLDIFGSASVKPYRLNPHAVVRPDGSLIYPPAVEQMNLPGLG